MHNLEGFMKLRVSLAVILFYLVGWALPVRAEGTTCASPTMVVPDGRITPSTINNGSVFFYGWRGTPGHSYSVELKSVIEPFNIAPGSVTIYSDSSGTNCSVPLTTQDTSLIDPQVSSGIRRSWIADGTAHWIKVQNTSGNRIDYTFSVADTTMYSPRWSTYLGFHTSWGINNTTNSTCNVTLNIRNTADVAVGGSPVTFPVAAGAIVFRVTGASDLNVGTDQAGKVTLTHDCPPAAIQVDAFMVNDTAVPLVALPVKFDAVREVR